MFQKKNVKLGSNILQTGIWSIIGTFLIKAVNLISIPVFSRMLNTVEYGEINLFMTYVTIFAVLLGMDFNGTLSKGSLEFSEQRYQYESSSLIFTAIFTSGSLLFFNMFSVPICKFAQMNTLEINLLLLYSYATFVISYFSADCIFQFKYKKNTAISLIVALSNFGLSALLIVTFFREERYYGRIIGAAVPTIIIAVIVLVFMICRGKIGVKWKYVKYSLKLSIPLIPHHLSGIVLSQADKIMINSMIGKAETGIYSLIFNVGWLMSVLVEALNNVWMPWLFRKMQDNVKQIRESSILYLGGFSIIALAIITISPELVKIIAPESYWSGIQCVVWIVFATYVVFLYYFYVNIECFYKKTYLISIGTVMAAVINILLNFWGLERFGFGFASISTVISYTVLLIFHYISVRFIIGKKIVSDLAVMVFFIIMLVYSLITQKFLENILIRLLTGSIFGISMIRFVILQKRKSLDCRVRV